MHSLCFPWCLQCLTKSVFIPPEKCCWVCCMGWGVSAAPATWGLLMNNLSGALQICWSPESSPKEWFSPNFTPNLLPLPLSWSWEMLTGVSPPVCALCSTFQLFLSCPHHPTISHSCFDSSSCCSLAQQRAPCFPTPALFLSLGTCLPQKVSDRRVYTAKGVSLDFMKCLKSMLWFCYLS